MLEIVGSCETRLFGLSQAERLRRQRGSAAGPVLVAHASAVLSDAAVAWLIENPGTMVSTPSNRPVAIAVAPGKVAAAKKAIAATGSAGFPELNPAMMPEQFVRKLRRRDKLLVRSLDEQSAGTSESELFDSVYKGVTDLVTKYAWPLPALWVTRLCAALGITPNMVTLVGIAAMAVAAWLWTQGEIVPGLGFAWLMTFLDTVDGKLARVTVTSSELGNRLDHVTDFIHPPIWWVCLAVGLGLGADSAVRDIVYWSCAVILATYAIGRATEAWFKQVVGYNAYLWQRFDSRFRLIVSRRNIILLIMTVGVALGAAWQAFAVAAGWSVVSAIIQLVRLAQARAVARRGEVRSWLM
ncbi:CDP-alcohol phosphatidyltransferase family protein [Sphingomonas sp.]|uniref:CDP-alcohol phosphatidyltransferase family protein n=1 Tax=Sphingomonas sp. TaxID=28214 RepID=UPI00286DBCB3|nr:CDP-alcohol phosphatidyltransferase family protein [Sphingomonas sp.]